MLLIGDKMSKISVVHRGFDITELSPAGEQGHH